MVVDMIESKDGTQNTSPYIDLERIRNIAATLDCTRTRSNLMLVDSRLVFGIEEEDITFGRPLRRDMTEAEIIAQVKQFSDHELRGALTGALFSLSFVGITDPNSEGSESYRIRQNIYNKAIKDEALKRNYLLNLTRDFKLSIDQNTYNYSFLEGRRLQVQVLPDQELIINRKRIWSGNQLKTVTVDDEQVFPPSISVFAIPQIPSSEFDIDGTQRGVTVPMPSSFFNLLSALHECGHSETYKPGDIDSAMSLFELLEGMPSEGKHGFVRKLLRSPRRKKIEERNSNRMIKFNKRFESETSAWEWALSRFNELLEHSKVPAQQNRILLGEATTFAENTLANYYAEFFLN
jgi:hypothetical protein